MPFYVGDYLRDTDTLTAEEHGAYLLLILHYWTNGGLPQDEKLLQKISKISPYKWQKIRTTMFKLFGPNWTHKRIDAELQKAHKISIKRELAGAMGGTTRAAKKGGKGLAFARNSFKQMPVYHKENNIIDPTTYSEPPVVSDALLKTLKGRGR